MQKSSLESQTSDERIRRLVESEGKAARNLVTWSVPAVDSNSDTGSTTTVNNSCSPADASVAAAATSSNQLKKDDSFHNNKKSKERNQRRGGGGKGREKIASPRPPAGTVTKTVDNREDRYGGFVQTETIVKKRQGVDEKETSGAKLNKGAAPVVETPLTSNPPLPSDLELSEEMCKAAAAGHYGNRKPRVRKSPGRKVKDLHARYWSYLFDNLHRAVDEIYNTCETDESIVECQEVIMTLDNCRRDFVELIKRFELFERSDLQSSSSKLAWEVRKTTSPSKPRPQPPLPYSRSHPRPPNLAKQQEQEQSSLSNSLGQLQRRDANSSTASGTTTKPTSTNLTTTGSSTNSGDRNGRDATVARNTPSSVRALDFGGNGGRRRGRKVWPSEGNGSSSVNAQVISSCSSLPDQAMPTWADRVRGGVPHVKFSLSNSNSKVHVHVHVPSSTSHHHHHGANAQTKETSNSSTCADPPDPEKKSSNLEEMSSETALGKANVVVQSGANQLGTGEEESDGGGRWEMVNSSRSQSRNTSTSIACDKETACTSVAVGKRIQDITYSASSNNDKKQSPIIDTSSSKVSPSHDVISLGTGSSTSPSSSQSGLMGHPSDECFVNVSIDSGGAVTEEKLTIEDLASGAVAAQLLQLQDEEKEVVREKDEEMKDGDDLDVVEEEGDRDDSTSCIGAKLSLSQASDKDSGWSQIIAEYEAGADYRSDMSWADRCESPPDVPLPDVLPEVPRSPGRAIHLHQRLSSPSRKRPVEDVEESRRLQEEKQAKAQQQRYRIQEEKAQRSKLVADKIRGVRESRNALIRQRKEALEGKLQRAVKMRESHLQEIVRKAQEEEAKVSEISFINTLEAQNKKIEVLERYQGREARLQELQEERQRKREEQLAKEEAAQERRRAIEAERQAKLMELQEKRREQDAKLEQKRQEKEKAREEAARERERKLEARNAAIQSSAEELEKKILLKQNESSRRYDQQLEQKKKATVSSRHASTDDAPRVEAYKKKKWCTICNVRIVSDVYLLSHLRGRKHQDMLSSLNTSSSPSSSEVGADSSEPVIIEASEEHQGPPCERPEVLDRVKAGKKRAKKLRHRIASRTRELEGQTTGQQQKTTPTQGTLSKNRAKLQKALRDFNKQVDKLSGSSQLGGAWDSSLINQIDRSLGEMKRTLSSSSSSGGGGTSNQLCFCHLGGPASILKMLLLCSDVTSPSNGGGSGCGQGRGKPPLPEKTFLLSVGVLESACSGHVYNCRHLLLSSKATALVDLSLQLLVEALPPKEPPQGGGTQVGGAFGSKVTPLCGPLLSVLASMISTLAFGPLREDPTLLPALTDVISYMVSVGLVDRLGDHFNTIVGPIGDSSLTQLVLGGLNLLVATTACMHTRVTNLFSEKPVDDPTLMTVVLRQTELVGLMQLLYAILLHDGPPRHSSSPPPLTNSTLSIATATIKTVNNFAIIDLKTMQACLGAEGISLEFRHIVSYLLWYCSYYEKPALLHELILAIGYFCVLNNDNQVFLQSGRSPTLLQLLCGLPFQYFSNKEHSQLLYPTLISACYQVETNRELLKQEMSCRLLVAFLESNIEEESSNSALPMSKASPPTARCGQDEVTTTAAADKKIQNTVDHGSLFEHRFPKLHWRNAVSFFSS